MKINKKLIGVLSGAAVLAAAIFFFWPLVFGSDRENHIVNPSFENDIDGWTLNKIGNSDLVLTDTFTSAVYELDPASLSKRIVWQYRPEIFSGETSKSIVLFNFYGLDDKFLARLTYVLNGSADHGSYQNYIVDGVSYAVLIMGDQIKMQQDNSVNLELLRDYNALAQEFSLRGLNKEEIGRTEFNFYSACPASGCIKAVYKESFLDDTTRENPVSQTMAIDDPQLASRSPIYLTNYLPTDGTKYFRLCTPSGEARELIQESNLVPGNYLLLADIKVPVGRTVPQLQVLRPGGAEAGSTAVNLNMAQTGWTSAGFLFQAKEAGKYSFRIRLPNEDNPNAANCAYLDNIRLHGLTWRERAFPLFFVRQFGLRHENDAVLASRLDYSRLYTPEFRARLDRAYREEIDIPIYDLYLDEDSFWRSDVREDYSNAQFVSNGHEYRVKVKIRGDGEPHWATPVKSWRVDFKDPGYLDGQGAINLIRPIGRGYVGEPFSYYLAKKMGLIALDDKFVFLRVNDKPYGLMYELEDWSADILEKNGRPVGNLYGENNQESIGQDEQPGGGMENRQNLKKYVLDWKKYAADPYHPKKDRTDIFLLTAAINYDLRPYYRSLVDEEEFLKWNAHSVLVGSQHQDNIHNNRLYFNNTSGSFEYIPWDLRFNALLGHASRSKYNSFIDYLLQDKNYFGRRNELLYSYLQEEKNWLDDHDFYFSAYEKVRNELFSLDNLDMPGYRVLSEEEISKEIEKNDVRIIYRRLKEDLEKTGLVRAYFYPQPAGSDSVVAVELRAEGTDDFDIYRVKSIDWGNGSYRLYRDDGDGVFSAADTLIQPGQLADQLASRFHYETYSNVFPDVIRFDVWDRLLEKVGSEDKQAITASYIRNEEKGLYYLNAGFVNVKDPHLLEVFRDNHLIPEYEPLRYFIAASGPIDWQQLMAEANIKVVTNSALKDVPIEKGVGQKAAKAETGTTATSGLERVPILAEDKGYVSLKDFNFPVASREEFLRHYPIFKRSESRSDQVILPAGRYEVSETIVIPADLAVAIKPGADLLFAAGVSFISYSPVEAVGTDDQPIKFQWLKPGRAWGVAAIVNAGPSRLAHCQFVGGGSAALNDIYFSGMLSVYHSDATISNCAFSRANEESGDDAVNLKNGRFTVKDNIFDKNSFDALDLDFAAEGSAVLNNIFTANGNDGLDISGSELTIAGNSIKGSVDKCISVGERSHAAIKDNRLEGCNFGVAVKDSSVVDFTDNKVMGNKVGAAAYNKKEIFGGATINISRSEFSGNRQDFGVEVFDKDDKQKNYEPDRYRSYCYVSESQSKTSGRKIREVIKEPKQKITSKKKLLQLEITDTMEDVGYKYATLANFCISK